MRKMIGGRRWGECSVVVVIIVTIDDVSRHMFDIKTTLMQSLLPHCRV